MRDYVDAMIWVNSVGWGKEIKGSGRVNPHTYGTISLNDKNMIIIKRKKIVPCGPHTCSHFFLGVSQMERF